jgi:hypothetical protein
MKKMNTEEEIQDIKERLDHIEEFLKSRFPSSPSSHDEASYEVLDLQVKKSESSIGPEYAYKLKVKNSSNTTLTFSGYIIFLDSSEFEVDRNPIGLFTVQAGQTHTQTGKATIFDENHASRISDVTAEIYPI